MFRNKGIFQHMVDRINNLMGSLCLNNILNTLQNYCISCNLLLNHSIFYMNNHYNSFIHLNLQLKLKWLTWLTSIYTFSIICFQNLCFKAFWAIWGIFTTRTPINKITTNLTLHIFKILKCFFKLEKKNC